MKKLALADVWVIVPAYNEAKYIQHVLRRLRRKTASIIVVNDGSSDSTAELAQALTPYVLTHAINLGKGASLKTGCEFAFRSCGAKAVIFLDGDEQHDPADLKLFIQKLQGGHEVIFGVRSLGPEMPYFRSLKNRCASLLIALFFGQYIPDILSGYKAFTKKAFDALQWQTTGYSVEMEIAARVAKKKMPFSTVCIRTIYHDMNKGMTMLDVLHIVGLVASWRVSL